MYLIKSCSNFRTIQQTMILNTATRQPSSFLKNQTVEYSSPAKLVTWPQSNWSCVSVLEDQTEDKKPQRQARSKIIAQLILDFGGQYYIYLRIYKIWFDLSPQSNYWSSAGENGCSTNLLLIYMGHRYLQLISICLNWSLFYFWCTK